MALKFGDVVKVKKGVMDPDVPNLELSGWMGRITEYNGIDIVCLKWDSITLKNIPDIYMKTLIDIGCEDCFETCLGVDELEVVQARDTEGDVEAVRESMSRKIFYYSLYEEEFELIWEILEDAEDNENEAWQEYLEENLTFPIKAEVVEGRWANRSNNKVVIQGLFDEDFTDTGYGILTNLKDGRNLPLADLEALEEGSINYTLMHWYSVWFANR